MKPVLSSFPFVLLSLLPVSAHAGDPVHAWSQRYGDTGSEYVHDIAADGDDNVIQIGRYNSTIDLGGGVLSTAGSFDMYLAKLDPAGNHVWSQSFGDAGAQAGFSTVAVDKFDNIIIAGTLQSSVDFGGGTLTSAGSNDIFLAKFFSNGAHAWSKRFGDANTQEVEGVAVDGSGDIAIVGWVGDSADFWRRRADQRRQPRRVHCKIRCRR